MKHFAEEVRVLVGAKDIFSSPIPFRNFKMKVFLNKEQFGGERSASALAPSSPSPVLHLSHCDIISEPHSLPAIFISAYFTLPYSF